MSTITLFFFIYCVSSTAALTCYNCGNQKDDTYIPYNSECEDNQKELPTIDCALLSPGHPANKDGGDIMCATMKGGRFFQRSCRGANLEKMCRALGYTCTFCSHDKCNGGGDINASTDSSNSAGVSNRKVESCRNRLFSFRITYFLLIVSKFSI